MSVTPFRTLALKPHRDHVIIEPRKVGRRQRGGQALKAFCWHWLDAWLAGRFEEEEINSGVKCSALVPQIAACVVRRRHRRRA